MSESSVPAPSAAAEGWWRMQGRMLRFFVPLALQSASQVLSFLLVSSIVAHGRLREQELAAYSQGQSIIWILGAIGSGLITTCMVFGRSRTGMANFLRLNVRTMFVAITMELLCCVPPLDGLVFDGLLGLSGEMAWIARRTLLFSVPLQAAFYLRNPYLAQLLVEKRSGAANLATLARLALAFVLAPPMIRLGLTGHAWGALAITLPVALETWLTRRLALPGMRALSDEPGAETASVGEQLRFTIPLSFGGVMISATMLGTAYFLGHAPDHVAALPVHYVVTGLINPVSFAALRMQSVTIAFAPGESGVDRRAPGAFAAMTGAAMCLILLIPQIPALARLYFTGVQNLPPELVGYARAALAIAAPIPLLQALKGHGEGLAALRRRPNAILADQAVYAAVYVGVISTVTRGGLIPGPVTGLCGITLAIAASLAALRVALVANDYERRLADSHFGTAALRARR
jgi:hypothetical protein